MALPANPGGCTAATPAPPTPGAKREATQRDKSAHLSQRIRVREARKVVVEKGWDICGSRLKRLVRWHAESRSDLDIRTWFIAYADPTGETAVRNVMREGGGRRAT